MSGFPTRTNARRARIAGARHRWGADEGTSLVEMVVGMTLMSVFLAMFTGAIVMMNRAMNQAQAVNTSASQLNTAFTALDNTVRYASYITTPGVSGTSANWYVELRSPRAGAELCTQLRVDKATAQLQSRTWTVTGSVVSAAGAWRPLASGIANGAAGAGATTQPFYLVPRTANAAAQQLTVNLTAPAGSGPSQVTSRSSLTYTAVNSSASAPVARVCQQQGRP